MLTKLYALVGGMPGLQRAQEQQPTAAVRLHTGGSFARVREELHTFGVQIVGHALEEAKASL